MTKLGMFANGLGAELASMKLIDGVVFRLGRAIDSHHRVGKGELFVEFYRGEEFLLGGPLKTGPPLKGAFAPKPDRVDRRIVRWGLADAPPEDDGAAEVLSRSTVSVPEGVVWVELRTA